MTKNTPNNNFNLVQQEQEIQWVVSEFNFNEDQALVLFVDISTFLSPSIIY